MLARYQSKATQGKASRGTAMFRFKESMLNEPGFWLTLLRIPPQAPVQLTPAPKDASGQCGIASRRIDGSSNNSQDARHSGDSGFKCKV